MPLRLFRSAPRTHRRLLVDTAVALLLFGVFAAALMANPTTPRDEVRWLGWEGYLVGAFATLPLAVRRVLPSVTLLAVAGGSTYYQLLEGPSHPVLLLAVFLAIFSVGVHARSASRDLVRAGAVAGLLAGALGVAAFGQVAIRPPPLQLLSTLAVAADAVVYAAGWVLGEQWRTRREREAQLAARTAELRRERERNAQRAVSEERLRIAREVHDVVGHHVSVMGVQAAGARRVLANDAERAGTVLSAIEESARHAVTELQTVLALLRDGNDRPRPELARVTELAAELRATGIQVDVQVEPLPPLPAGVELAATRVVQEALTNVLRHAGPGTHAWVRVHTDDHGLSVTITDDGRGHPTPDDPATAGGTGTGLAGLRERVTLHHGRFHAGPRPHGGYRVTAHLPLAVAVVDRTEVRP